MKDDPVPMTKLTHIDKSGRASMVDVSNKDNTARRAVAQGFVKMNAATLELALSGETKKGAVIPVAELAGIMAAKRTSDLIPLCHPLPPVSYTHLTLPTIYSV